MRAGKYQLDCHGGGNPLTFCCAGTSQAPSLLVYLTPHSFPTTLGRMRCERTPSPTMPTQCVYCPVALLVPSGRLALGPHEPRLEPVPVTHTSSHRLLLALCRGGTASVQSSSTALPQRRHNLTPDFRHFGRPSPSWCLPHLQLLVALGTHSAPSSSPPLQPLVAPGMHGALSSSQVPQPQLHPT